MTKKKSHFIGKISREFFIVFILCFHGTVFSSLFHLFLIIVAMVMVMLTLVVIIAAITLIIDLLLLLFILLKSSSLFLLVSTPITFWNKDAKSYLIFVFNCDTIILKEVQEV
jgi:hypothetical protein